MADAPYEVIGTIEDREAWLAARQTGIGSSDAPAVLGVPHAFSSAVEVYARKLGAMPDKPESERMRWGTRLEPTVVQVFEEETGRPCRRNKVLLRSTRCPWALATLDATQEKSGDFGLLEVKCTEDHRDEWKDGVPPRVMAQVQHQFLVTGYRWGSVAVLIRGSEFYWKDVERDDDFIERKLLPACEDFWRRVTERIPPAPDGTTSAKLGLDALFPETNGKTVQLPGSFIELDERRSALKMELKDAKAECDRLEQEIKAAIGEADAGALPNGVVYTFKVQKRDGYVVKPTTFRVLRRSGEKED